jgi:anti-sigma factor RsiW
MTRSMPHFALPHLSDEAVAAFADGVLSGGPRSRAQQHLSECADCASAIREQQQARLTLRSAAAPMVPGSLLARLRELPTSTPLGGQPATVMSAEGYPEFAAFDSRRPAVPASPLTPAARPPALRTATEPVPAQTHPAANRRLVPGFGVSAAAAAAVIVGVLASTAATAGGAQPTPVRSGVNSPVSVPGQSGTARTVPILNLVGR